MVEVGTDIECTAAGSIETEFAITRWEWTLIDLALCAPSVRTGTRTTDFDPGFSTGSDLELHLLHSNGCWEDSI